MSLSKTKFSLQEFLDLPESGDRSSRNRGDDCWVGELCHKRRTYYKKRDLYNRNRRLKYRGEKESEKQLESIAIPSVPAIVVYFYQMWSIGGQYADPGMDYYEQRYQRYSLNN